MSLEVQQSVFDSLQHLRSLNALKELFWSKLNYERVNQLLSRRKWTEPVANALVEDPLLLASGGSDNDFHVIYGRLNSEHLQMGLERNVVNRLLQEHPYTLFVFSNQAQSRWHFLNVKYDTTPEKRKLFRRITVGVGEQLRTATEQLGLLDLESVSLDASPLAIQQRHDEAFDVEVVTKNFFEKYAQVFGRVESLIQETIREPERRRLFTQKLFNRLMFIAFIQKKGWLRFNGRTDYLSALWSAYQQDNSTSNKNFYRDRLSILFFTGLNKPQKTDITSINNGGHLKNLIGTVPYLNGGLFEQDESDRDYKIVVPDKCIDTILHDLFDRFNFTVTESTPLDVEVAVDPEMLGKVFEELVTGRHASGSYYTPKPIVSFMCREALKGYLQSQLPGAATTDIEQFVEEHNPDRLRNPEAVLEALRRVRTCDAACGSGAYLLGILQELLNLRQCLFATKGLDSKSVYQRKVEIIENNLYGVDIDPFAVNIARLRLWLSLAVEYEGDDPPPLPNLKFKIEVGDSLIAPSPKGIGAFRDELVHQYRDTKARYLKAHLGGEKQTLEQQITELKTQIALMTHGSSKVPGFDWAVEFAEIFADGGFDIQVANPPYVRHELITHLKPTLEKVYPTVYTGTADLYCYFYARALQLLRPGGMLAFISSNKWFRANYGSKLRKHIAETCQVHSIIDFGELPVFQSAATFPMIFVAQQGKMLNGSTLFTQIKSLEPPYPDVAAILCQQNTTLPLNAINGSNWILTENTVVASLQRMDSASVPLLEYVKNKLYVGIKTGFNRAFWIDGEKRAELIAQDPNSEEIIKPLAVGNHVRKWKLDCQNKWVIVTHVGVKIERYPAVFAHLSQWKSELKARSDQGNYWWELRPCAYYSDFEKPKIIFPDIAQTSRFTIDLKGMYVDMTAFVIPTNDLYLLGVLNSTHVWSYLCQTAAVLGDAERGGRLRLKRVYVKKIPIPKASKADRAIIASLVQKCIDAKGVECEAWEQEIDEMVAVLYGL